MSSCIAVASRNVCCHCKAGRHENCKLPHCTCCGSDIEEYHASQHEKAQHEKRRVTLAQFAKVRQGRVKVTTRLSWDHDLRVAMYKELVEMFGPFADWECPKSRRPVKAGTLAAELFEKWIIEWGEMMCRAQGLGPNEDKRQAIEMQIAWAVTKQDMANLPERYKIQRDRNAAAAKEAGFI